MIIRVIIMILSSFMIGFWIAPRSHAQVSNRSYYDTCHDCSTNIAVLASQFHAQDETIRDVLRKMEALKSQADTTQATGVGIGITITFLQLLGFITTRKQERISLIKEK